jgi:hypothetical protein
LLRPFRQMTGQPAPGTDLDGRYNRDPNYVGHKDYAGFASGTTFGQSEATSLRVPCGRPDFPVLHTQRTYRSR